MRRVLVGALALGLFFVVLGSPRAGAMTINDPWTPPSVATHDGLASAALAVSGALVPLVPGADPADVLTSMSPPLGTTCSRVISLWSWSGSSLTVTGGSVGSVNACGFNQLPSIVWTYGCVVKSAYYDATTARTRLVGEMYTSGSMTGASASSVTVGVFTAPCTYTGMSAANMTVAWIKLATWSNGGASTSDGLVTFKPGVMALYPPVVTVTTHCSDNSTVTASFGGGVAVSVPACVTGVFASAEVVAGGQVAGNVAVHPAFQGHSCLASVGACVLWVTWAGGACANNDASCPWWGTTSPATACDWKNESGQMWALSVSDCEAARHDGWDVPANGSTSSAQPTVTVTAGGSDPTIVVSVPQPTVIVNVPQPTVNVSVNVNVEPLQPAPIPAGGCLSEVVVWNPESWVMEPIRCALTPVNYRIGGVADAFTVCAPDPTHDGAIKCTDTSGSGCPPNTVSNPLQEKRPAGGWESKCMSGTWTEWQQAFQDFVNAWTPGAGSGCEGPLYNLPMIHPGGSGLVIAVDYPIHPFQACVEPGITYAAMSTVALRAIIMIGAFLASWQTIRRLVKA